MQARCASRIRATFLTLGVAAFVATAFGPVTALAEEAGACSAKAERMCRRIEDPSEHERCLVEREVECEIVGSAQGRKAADREPPRRLRTACRADFQRLCDDVGGAGRRGEGARCLREHRDDLSEACRAALDARASARHRSRERAGVCRDEIRELCPDAAGRQSMRSCVRENRDQLSDTCRQALAERARRRGHGGGFGEGHGRN
jgi:hypothetical protein